MKFGFLNAVAVFCTTVSFALFITAITTPWFFTAVEYSSYNAQSGATEISGSTRLNKTTTEYDVNGVVVEVSVGTSGSSQSLSTFDWGSDDIDGSVEDLFSVVKGFVVVGIVFSIILLVVLVTLFFRTAQKAGLPFPQKLWNFILAFFAFLAFLGGFVAFLQLLTVNKALDSDTPGCTSGFCKKFHGTEQDKLDTNSDGTVETLKEVSWGPTTAWYCSLVAFIFLIPVIFIAWINRIPAEEFGEEETGVAL
jgi:hypothetical protein